MRWPTRSIATLILAGVLPSLGLRGAVPLTAPDLPVRLPRISPRPATVSGVSLPCLDLGGSWRFNPNPPADFASQRDHSVGTGWATIQVPGQWTQQGFTVDPKNAAGYWRQVAIPADWAGRRIKLRCDGVYSLATVWVNGREIGKHDGGFTPFELDVTDAVKPGTEAVLALAVSSSGDADQMSWARTYAGHDLGGIARKAQLLALPAVNIASLHATAVFEGGFEKAAMAIRLAIANDASEPSSATTGSLDLRDPQNQSAGKLVFNVPAIAAGKTAVLDLQIPVSRPQLWDVEHPWLYTLATTVGAGSAAEMIRTRVGFRTVEMREREFVLNGRPIKLRGINRHEIDPLRGRSLQGEIWRQDAELLRRANVTIVRTSHYPPAEEFLDVCDELGIMVESEAPVCHAVTHAARLARQTEAITQNAMEMVEFSRNHPSVVIWSLGNESPYVKLFGELSALIRQVDPTRPRIFSDNAKNQEPFDIASYHYPTLEEIQHCAKVNRLGTFFDEYAHLNDSNRRELLSDSGVRDAWGYKLVKLWDTLRTTPGSIGGAIWTAIDDSFFLPDGRVVGYGPWAPIDAWRRPKPEYWHIKKIYSPVSVSEEHIPVPAMGSPIRLTVENRSDFADLNEMHFNWTLSGRSGSAKAQAAPGATAVLEIPTRNAKVGSILELHVIGPRGFEVDAYRWCLGEGAARVPEPLQPAGELKLGQTEGEVIIEGKGFAYLLDATTGQFKLARIGGRELAVNGPCLTLVPMNCENYDQRRMSGQEPDPQPIFGLCKDWKPSAVSAAQSGDKITVKVSGSYTEAKGVYDFTFDGSGRVALNWNFTFLGPDGLPDFSNAVKQAKARNEKVVQMRQMGVSFVLPKSCDTLAWRRRGQWNYYPVDHIGRLKGRVRADLGHPFYGRFVLHQRPSWPWSEDSTPYGCNDFRSAKLNIVEASLCDEQGAGLRAVAAADRHAHAWQEGAHAFFAVLDYANDGINEGFNRSRYAFAPRLLGKEDVIVGSAQVELVGSTKAAWWRLWR